MIENVTEWISLAITATTTLATIIFYFKSKSKTKTIADYEQESQKLQGVVELAKIVQKIPGLVREAEKLFPSTGDTKYGPAKLNYVLKELQIMCISNNIEYQESALKYEVEQVLSTPQKKEDVCAEKE